MSATTTTTARYTLSCHVVMAPAGKTVGQQVRCPECSEAAGKPVRPRIKAVVNPTGDEAVDAALGQLVDELSSLAPADAAPAAQAIVDRRKAETPGDRVVMQAVSDVLTGAPVPSADDVRANVSAAKAAAAARGERLARARKAAAAGDDPAEVLAEPLPTPAKAKRAKAADWCIRFRNMSAARRDACAFAGWPHKADGPLVICDPQSAAAFTGLLKGSLNRVADQPQPTDRQRRTIEQMLRVIDNQRAARAAQASA